MKPIGTNQGRFQLTEEKRSQDKLSLAKCVDFMNQTGDQFQMASYHKYISALEYLNIITLTVSM